MVLQSIVRLEYLSISYLQDWKTGQALMVFMVFIRRHKRRRHARQLGGKVVYARSSINASLLTNASLVISAPLLVKKDLAVDGCTYYGHVEWQMVLRKWCVI